MTILQERLLTNGPHVALNDVAALNTSAGGYWFSPDTVRFFKSRVLDLIKLGQVVYLVESSKAGFHASDGRRHRLLALDIFDPVPVKVINEGPGRGPVMRAFKLIALEAVKAEGGQA